VDEHPDGNESGGTAHPATAGSRRRYDPDMDRWRPLALPAVRPLLDRTGAWLSGGVGLDLWLGFPSRIHGDIDVSVLAVDWPWLQAALPARLRPYAAQSGWLTPLDQVAPDEQVEDIWCRDERSADWCLQVNIETGDGGRWTYRRDERISRPWVDAVIEIHGIRVVAPAVQLLWKSAEPGAKDDADRILVEPRLAAAERLWLRHAIASAHPASAWNTR
jgi:hypothetical protein